MKTIDNAASLSEQDKQALQEIVHGFLPDGTILLYGSMARDTQDPESDYDALILTDHSFSSKPIPRC